MTFWIISTQVWCGLACLATGLLIGTLFGRKLARETRSLIDRIDGQR